MSNAQNIPHQVFRVWNHRLKIEIEAAHLFHHLGEEMSLVWGKNDPIAQLCFQSAEDEHRHAERCQQILNLGSAAITKEIPQTNIHLGPQHLELHERVLYASVAIGCVTETLSTALLLRMHQCAQDGLIKDTIHEILEDEIAHSRIGWAEIARYSQIKSPSWLAPYFKGMIDEAIQSDVKPMTNQTEQTDLSPWGILSSQESQLIMRDTISEVVFPGLQRYMKI